MKIRALIVEDELLARQRIRLMATDEPDLEIIGECGSGADALASIERDSPDLLFLDVQMPEMDGFELLQRLPREQLPLVIFTTAYDKHAVRAFEAHALDYLLKPFQPDRFKAAVAHAREQLVTRRESSAARGLLDLLASRQGLSVAAPVQYLTRLTIKGDDKVSIIKTAEIDSIESAGNYVSVNVGKQGYILRQSLNALEKQLDPEQFLRVSRSTIVNLERVKELQPMFKGEHIIVLQNGKKLPMTRGLLRGVERALKFR
ncbi:MAG TPA: LytTR family DNA-binding domain-containing protein [Terriglobales bacterium]|nr:LytTR family DNA-binding domain-containing protein [Terriglobales bacterium]